MASASSASCPDTNGIDALRGPGDTERVPNELALSRHDANNDDDGDTQGSDEDVVEERDFNPAQCLFCNRFGKGAEDNLEHMRITHGLIIPAKDHLIVDIETLLGYMHLVIFGYFECLFCGRQRYTAQAAQQHMTGSGHCKMDHLSKGSEFRDFYDFDSDEGEEAQHGNKNGNTLLNTTPPNTIQPDDNTLRLPSGKLVSNKNFHSRHSYRQPGTSAGTETRAQMEAGSSGGLESSSHYAANTTSTTASGSVVKSRSEKRDAAFTGQLANLRAEDRRSLIHLPLSQQRALIATRQKQDKLARVKQQAVQRRVERSGNKTLMMHFIKYAFCLQAKFQTLFITLSSRTWIALLLLPKMHSKEPEFSEKDVPDLSGYVSIVTGGNSGIGYETANQLALHNARVYIASRSRGRVNEAIQKMSQSAEGKALDLHFLQMDLQDLKSVKAAATHFMTLENHLDILINNAGVMTVPYKLTGDGFETQWQVNYLAPHIFTSSLIPLLLSTASVRGTKDRVRVVNVSSDAAFFGPDKMQWDDVNMTSTKGMLELWKRYGHSKQASIRDAKEINDRYSSQGVTAYSVHPGIVKSNLQGHDPTIIGSVVRVAMKLAARDSPLHGALNSLYCATSSSAPSQGQGMFFTPVGKLDSRADKWISDRKGNAQLWQLGEDQLKLLQ
ncbi:hypothetical protein AK830_g4061 [Neonectria ditissima]|uniref:ZN622/Rei1/Reh1 zinc finger C2H2-type domain-containing protein n=1 Tax=Neonectria ditissima TaxID=78410 RepID=A0A0P7B7J0_9HYPO|nr:hypothetical protein AK830_g4061 [Neonectria ditissima]